MVMMCGCSERERGVSGDDMCGCSEGEREGLVVMVRVVVQRERERKREREREGLVMVMMCVVVHLVIFHLIRYAQIQKTEKSSKVKSALVLDKQRA